MIGLPISIFITGDRAKAFDWISVTTVCIDLSIDAMTNFLNAISIHCNETWHRHLGLHALHRSYNSLLVQKLVSGQQSSKHCNSSVFEQKKAHCKV